MMFVEKNYKCDSIKLISEQERATLDHQLPRLRPFFIVAENSDPHQTELDPDLDLNFDRLDPNFGQSWSTAGRVRVQSV